MLKLNEFFEKINLHLQKIYQNKKQVWTLWIKVYEPFAAVELSSFTFLIKKHVIKFLGQYKY